MVAVKTFSPNKILAPSQQMETKAPQNVHVKVEPGQLLFSKGDAGGDLFFIEKGTVEIFVTQLDQEIVLTEMSTGEVIGVMTLLTLDPRLASCRAKDLVIVKKISKKAVASLIAALPNWLHIVLKEFTGRIVEMNRLYSETLVDLKKARENQITPLFVATQMAPTASLLARGLKDASESVAVSDLLGQLVVSLNQPKEMISNIWKVFVSTGCVTVTNDSSKKTSVVTIKNLLMLATFTEFLAGASKGPNRKIFRAKFTTSEIKSLAKIGTMSLTNVYGAEIRVSVKMSDLTTELEKLNDGKVDLGALDKASKAGLITSTGNGDTLVLAFAPVLLVQTLGFLAAIKKLSGEIESKKSPAPAPDSAPSSDEANNTVEELPAAGSTPAA